MRTTAAGVPQVLTRQGDAWDDDTFQQEWAEMVCTWQPRQVQAADFDGKTMAHVMAELKLFPSVGQARKAGWDGAVTAGLHRVGKTWVEVV